jgi:tRNAThr (cytosine32-N3)-methyltransferase
MNEAQARASAALDAAHEADPRREDGAAYERLYADRLEAWVRRLVPQPSAALRLAARAQHLERWAIPRDTYPEGRGGYLRWRSDVHRRQGERVREILGSAGIEPSVIERVGALVAKAAPRGDAEAQALEDAACLVFLETELVPFLRENDRAKTIDVLRKTWKKMSPAGHQAATALALPAEAAAVVKEALGA